MAKWRTVPVSIADAASNTFINPEIADAKFISLSVTGSGATGTITMRRKGSAVFGAVANNTVSDDIRKIEVVGVDQINVAMAGATGEVILAGI